MAELPFENSRFNKKRRTMRRFLFSMNARYYFADAPTGFKLIANVY
jgi:hypothetical protein